MGEKSRQVIEREIFKALNQYLYEASLVAKTVATIRTHTMKMGLMFTITAKWILTIFVESTTRKKK